MVRCLITLIFVLSSGLYAADFTASVDRNHISAGNSITLTLTLSDVSAQGVPDTSPLKNAFTIHSQQQTSNTVVVNGKMSYSQKWKLILIPKNQGSLTIPSIGIDTTKGTLYSQPITVEVSDRLAGQSAQGAADGNITISSSISKANPYKNEPVTYTVKLVSKKEIANVRIGKVEVQDAIVDVLEEPQLTEKIVNGVKVYTLEINTLITPLKAGEINVPATVIRGDIPVKSRGIRGRSFFDDEFDPFQMMAGFGRLEPFAVATDDIVLDVKPAVAGIIPWLPATSLKIEEEWDESQSVKVGEPLTRSFKISAVGLKASQLPSLDRLQGSGDAFKVYADKPETNEHIVDQNLYSFRYEHFTIIPQKDGTVTLPEIQLPWWDVITDAKAVARVPARTLEVQPIAKVERSQSLSQESASPAVQEDQHQSAISQISPVIYGVIGAMALLLLIALIWVFALQRKISRMAMTPSAVSKPKTEKTPKVRFKELRKTQTPQELHAFLQSYAHNNWKTPRNATVGVVFDALKERSPEGIQSDIAEIQTTLEGALYSDRAIDIRHIAGRCSQLLAKCKNKKSNKTQKEKLPDLNPR